MIKKLVFLIVLLCLTISSVYGADTFDDKLRSYEKQRRKHGQVTVDADMRKKMQEFVVNNENVSVKDFKRFRTLGNASLTILEDLNRKYNVKDDDDQSKILNEREKNIYNIAEKLFKKYRYREFYACKNDDEVAAMESVKKVDAIRGRISLMLQKDRKMQDSDEVIRLQEQILEECRFGPAAYSLLDSYRIRGMRNNFNDLMLRIIRDDQVNYDYLFRGIDTLNTSFVGQYLHLLKDVNGQNKKLILSEDQVRTIAEALLTKHQEVLNMRNAPYYSEEKGIYNETSVYEGVQSRVNVSNWLREYKLDDLNDKFVDKFFEDSMVLSTLRDDPWFKDYWQYLQAKSEKVN